MRPHFPRRPTCKRDHGMCREVEAVHEQLFGERRSVDVDDLSTSDCCHRWKAWRCWRSESRWVRAYGRRCKFANMALQEFQTEMREGIRNTDNTVREESAATRGAVEVRQVCSHPPTLLSVSVGSPNRNARRFGQDRKCRPSRGCSHARGCRGVSNV